MNQKEAVELMKSSASEGEWKANCKKVKSACGGQYPDFWHSAIIMPGLAGRVIPSWGENADIKNTPLHRK